MYYYFNCHDEILGLTVQVTCDHTCRTTRVVIFLEMGQNEIQLTWNTNRKSHVAVTY